MEQRFLEEDFDGFLEDLIKSGRLDETEEGIIRQVLGKGYRTLSVRQKFRFDQAIKENYVSECKRCAIDIPWCEMLEATDNGGYCNYCQHMMEKIEAE